MAPRRWWHFSSHLVLSDHVDWLTDVLVLVDYAVLGVRLPGMVMIHRGDGGHAASLLSACWLITLHLLFVATLLGFIVNDLTNP